MIPLLQNIVISGAQGLLMLIRLIKGSAGHKTLYFYLNVFQPNHLNQKLWFYQHQEVLSTWNNNAMLFSEFSMIKTCKLYIKSRRPQQLILISNLFQQDLYSTWSLLYLGCFGLDIHYLATYIAYMYKLKYPLSTRLGGPTF